MHVFNYSGHITRFNVSQSKSAAYFFGGWRLRCGRAPSSEVRDVAEVRDDSPGRAVVDGGPDMDWDPVRSSARERSCRSCRGSGGVNSSSGRFSSAGSERRGLLEGVDGVARPSQRVDRFDGRVELGVSGTTADAGLGK